jgi:hypothetical protein
MITMSRLAPIALPLALVSALSSAPLRAQPNAALVVDPTRCGACRLEARRVLSLGGLDAPLVGLPRVVIQDGAGNFIVQAGIIDRNPPLVFSPAGRYVGPLGRAGQGPGDVTPVQWIRADSIGRVEVYSRNRRSLFSTSQAFISTRTLRYFDKMPAQVVSLERGRTVGLTNMLGDGPDLHPLTFREADGQVLREVHLYDNRAGRPSRTIARAAERNGVVWLVEAKQVRSKGYEIDLVDTLGRVSRRLERTVGWWWSRSAPMTGFFQVIDTLPTPYPFVQHVRQDRQKRLMVLLGKTRANWKAVKLEDRWLDGNNLTVVEKLDPAGATLLGTAEVPGFALSILSDTRFATYREDANGIPWIDIWEIVSR